MDTPLSFKVERDGSVQTGATLRTFRVRCGPTDHAFMYAGGALSGNDLIFCGKCGEVRRLEVTEDDS